MSEAKQKKSSMNCRQCQGDMEFLTVKKHSGKWPVGLIVAGLLCFFFLGGPFLGIPLLLLGIYMQTAEVSINYCDQCGYYHRVWFKDDD
jgi:hypothetical protein